MGSEVWMNDNDLNPETEVDWNRLDETSWHDIFSYLDAKSLLNASETCQKFDGILSTSTRLLNKIKVSLRFPESPTEDEIRKFEERFSNVSQLTRPYQNLEILRLRERFLVKDEKLTKRLAKNFFSITTKLAESVKVLKIENCSILRQDLVSLLVPFSQLRECSLFNLMLADDFVPDEIEDAVSCPNLKSLQLVQCNFFCLLLFKSYDKLESLVVLEPAYARTDVEFLEDFLLQQASLKVLKLKSFRFNSSYSTNRLARVPFQLEELRLSNVHWDITDHCSVFMKSQTSLKRLHLSMFHRWTNPYSENHIWFDSVMKHLLTKNPMLSSLQIETKQSNIPEIKDVDFLPGVFNNNLKTLMYNRDSGDKSEFFKIFTRIFPKVQSFSFIDLSTDAGISLQNLQRFKHLDELNLKVTPKSLTDLQLASKLLTFKYCAINEEKSFEKLTEFFARNQSIKKVTLNIEPLTIEEITEMILSLSSSLETLSFADLHLNPSEAELLAENFKSLRTILSDYPLKAEILTILKTANIRFEIAQEEFLFK